METPKYLQTLWSYKWLLAFGLVVAIAAAFFAGFTITNGQVESRAVKSYTAGTTVLVTSPSDTLYQAQLPAQTVEQGVTAARTARPLRRPPRSTPTSWRGRPSRTRSSRRWAPSTTTPSRSPRSGARPSRPVTSASPASLKLPVLEIVGTAATEERAEDISAAATDAFLGYVIAEQDADQIPPENRVELEVLARNAAVEGDTSNPAIPIVITGVAVFLAFVALALILGGIRSSREKRRTKSRRRNRNAADAPSTEADGAEASVDASAPSSEHEDDAERQLVGAGSGPRTD